MMQAPAGAGTDIRLMRGRAAPHAPGSPGNLLYTLEVEQCSCLTLIEHQYSLPFGYCLFDAYIMSLICTRPSTTRPWLRALARCYSSSLITNSSAASPRVPLPPFWDALPSSKAWLEKRTNNPQHPGHNEAHALVNANLNPQWFYKDLMPKAIDRSFDFKHVNAALQFLTRVAEMSEKRGEYPRIYYVGQECTSCVF